METVTFKKTTLAAVGMILIVGAAGMYLYNMGSCLAGGGGYSVSLPDSTESGKPISLKLTLNAWGNTKCIKSRYWQNGKPANLFSGVQCHYKLKEETAYRSLPMALIENAVDTASYWAKYECAIPPEEVKQRPSEVDYYFDYMWGATPYQQRNNPPFILK